MPLGSMLSSRVDAPEGSHDGWQSKNDDSSQAILPGRFLSILLRSSESDEPKREDVQPPQNGVDEP